MHFFFLTRQSVLRVSVLVDGKCYLEDM
jgi:hypothetical protein